MRKTHDHLCSKLVLPAYTALFDPAVHAGAARTSLPKNFDPVSTEPRLYDWYAHSYCVVPSALFFHPHHTHCTCIVAALLDVQCTPCRWEQNGKFQPQDAATGKPFSMAMPPPNVTGRLHMGHAMFVTLQDIMTRYARMCNRPSLWLPGTDHAGIATQVSSLNHALLNKVNVDSSVCSTSNDAVGLLAQSCTAKAVSLHHCMLDQESNLL